MTGLTRRTTLGLLAATAFPMPFIRPEVAAGFTNYTYYANGNAASRPFINPEILANPAIYPDPEAMSRLWTPDAPSAEAQSAYTRLWTSIKAG